ncbi:hypothetical protein D3C73_941900 [compost metagenome]
MTAIPNPAMTPVSSIKLALPAHRRLAVAAMISATPAAMPLCSLANRRSGATLRAPKPITKTGRAVNRPAAVSDMRVAACNTSSKGGTDASTGRRFSPTRMMAAMRQAFKQEGDTGAPKPERIAACDAFR